MEDNSWHLNKGVPIALILTIFIQSIGAVWWASSLDSTVRELDDKITQVVAVQSRDKAEGNSENLRQWARINAVEAAVQGLNSNINTISAILQRVEEQVKDNNNLLREYLSE